MVCAQSRRVSLLHVHTFRNRIEPLLYRVVSVAEARRFKETPRRRMTSATYLEMLHSKAPSFLHTHVRHVALASTVSPDELNAILTKCGNSIVNLGLFHVDCGSSAGPFLDAIAHMPLRRLSADLEPLFGGCAIDMGHRVFSRLTHLDLFDINDYASPRDDWPARFAQLPALTHLSLNFAPFFIHRDHTPLLSGVLAQCENLGVLVLVSGDPRLMRSKVKDETYAFFAGDARAVFMLVDDFLGDWEVGADGGRDYWRMAEEFVRKRRCGEVEGESCVVAEMLIFLTRFSTIASNYTIGLEPAVI